MISYNADVSACEKALARGATAGLETPLFRYNAAVSACEKALARGATAGDGDPLDQLQRGRQRMREGLCQRGNSARKKTGQ